MLPDYVAPNLRLVFVGLNPGEYSARLGRYFARKQNLFWPALNASGLVPEPVGPEDDHRLLDFGIGLTDLVKRATPNVSHLAPDEFRAGGQSLRARLAPLAPRLVCFVGLMGYRIAFDAHARLGPQPVTWGRSALYLVPSTSPRNARYRPDIVTWFRRLSAYLDELEKRSEE